jgi:hypothetical protein
MTLSSVPFACQTNRAVESLETSLESGYLSFDMVFSRGID